MRLRSAHPDGVPGRRGGADRRPHRRPRRPAVPPLRGRTPEEAVMKIRGSAHRRSSWRWSPSISSSSPRSPTDKGGLEIDGRQVRSSRRSS
ncbi:MAG: hypothetical protein M0C28_01630 [Candidatus Moduliflexus flocculans]|nr:hypothetical protein [Candidatus Moduliflexus flocculans]